MAVAQQSTQLYTKQSALIPVGVQACIKGPDDDDDGLGALISGHAAQKHEEKRKIEAIDDSNIAKAFKLFLELVNVKDSSYKNEPIFLEGIYTQRSYHIELMKKLGINYVLSPLEIKTLFTWMQTYNDYEDERRYRLTAGIITSYLIQLSFENGNNNFMLHTERGHLIALIGAHLEGNEKKLLALNIYGDVGIWCGFHASYSAITIKGNYIGSDIAEGASNCIFNISCVERHGIVGRDSSNTTYKTTNEKMLRKIWWHIPSGKGNQIYFIHPDGREELKEHIY